LATANSDAVGLDAAIEALSRRVGERLRERQTKGKRRAFESRDDPIAPAPRRAQAGLLWASAPAGVALAHAAVAGEVECRGRFLSPPTIRRHSPQMLGAERSHR